MGPRQSFHDNLNNLVTDLLIMGDLVEQSIQKSVTALKNQDLQLANEVIEQELIIDEMELKIEDKCLKLIAMQQPMAKDLRKIATGLKIITDLERIADHAHDIAKVAIRLGSEPLIKPLVDIPRMAEKVQLMVKKALDAFVQENIDLALEVCKDDDEVDSLHNQIFRELLTYMMEDPKNISQGTQLLFVSSYLERIGDHATNLGEWLIYMVTGERKELND
ncbi:phosphate signaling complex protein PhoU [Anaerobranca gottschalkii]|uniref:Phosphate-specific transport system accessory protein PhoU n=1 Tax=Anaerobranca gottschalkii DSM 13577 TaxID=1120990 RepID=A0A1I0AFC7_9FIRM|nr:phosphate signaling complex protein PhoU [Anaerobranca gottschalkii]SES92904.1 phosphate uptake regulator, PhoU [Anaerobranca gottschalkii DSM 13577]